MPGEVIVGGIRELSSDVSSGRTASQLGRFVSVTFEEGPSALLNITTPQGTAWQQVLASLAGAPVYVEVDPDTNQISELLLPITVTVAEIVPTASGDGVEVELLISQARHYLRRSNPAFQGFLEALQESRDHGSPVLVTETLNQHEIIDVRPPTYPLGDTAALSAASPYDAAPSLTMAPVSLQRAQELFNLVNQRGCCAGDPTPPGIPFVFPDDGCWGRAHEMCRLMIAAGGQPGKVWIYGNLRVATHNHPDCQVRWGWHVAPTMQVSSGSGVATYVIDPSLFNAPVLQATWAGVQGDPAPALVPTDASVFHRSYGGSVIYDPTYAQTNNVLNTYRNQLRLRSASTAGPPPYPRCMPAAPRVQFTGVVPANASARWFTWGWPAAWHVLWTVMPLSQCPGHPTLSWATHVERADANNATYWLSVRNLTGGPVRFEGRYDILRR